ncbi:sugar nucleotide-binding protein [Nesterenkonia salmonea]|uniref:dTDP-4-dehydrorhamnose reductase n=1 Tax=Nesterenkonia salmonea TaxID=1804987 RepID=A0A5R9BCG0_9MICC|nr:bifunctional dTDP-4-dehydrorhamnose 3,5-epimerase family protein/NAD(P)-dependent oxidoreductase [Nesterenkonia salmonea]TLP97030.1 sugar nucleotide-binding protein [Nesterenkonia salmonea]
MTELSAHPTPIPGLLVFDLPLHGDSRGWFKENWQRAKMTSLGLPDFGPVQNNVSFNEEAGSTRGLHAEPWDKLISLAHGRIFGAWVDLRPGETYGTSFSLDMGPEKAVFVPRGVANGYQALEPKTVYSYLVNDHWSPRARDSYTYLNLADPTIGIDWPIPLDHAELSDADRSHPFFPDVDPVAPKPPVIVGASGQLGRALVEHFPEAVGLARTDIDLCDPASIDATDFSQFGVIINAAAYTAVDAAETKQGRRECWQVNVTGLAHLVEQARKHRVPMVHISSDYVFDGTQETHDEDEPLSPLGVYGQTKAAGEKLVSTLPKHWIVRTSWVIGQGNNFVRTMVGLASRGVNPSVVGDQYGRLTFTRDLVDGIDHLIRTAAPFGTYHLTNAGPPQSWADIAKRVFELSGRSSDDVTEVTTAQYVSEKQSAPRPRNSTLNLDKISATGFRPVPAENRLFDYLDEIQ